MMPAVPGHTVCDVIIALSRETCDAKGTHGAK